MSLLAIDSPARFANYPDMDERQRNQLTLITEHEMSLAKSQVEKDVNGVFADHAAKGRLHSGATIIVSLRAIGDAASQLLRTLVAKSSAVAADPEAFGLVSAATRQFLEYCSNEQLPKAIRMAEGRSPGSPDSSARRAALERFSELSGVIEAELAIAGYDFAETVKAPIRPPAPPPVAPATKRGRPPAEFWDDMWSAIAAGLYDGSLQPKNQADVERAMAEWIAANGHDAAASTVRARARRLWDRIQAD